MDGTITYRIPSAHGPRIYTVWGPYWLCSCPAPEQFGCWHRRYAEYMHRCGISDPCRPVKLALPPNPKWYKSDEARALLDLPADN